MAHSNPILIYDVSAWHLHKASSICFDLISLQQIVLSTVWLSIPNTLLSFLKSLPSTIQLVSTSLFKNFMQWLFNQALSQSVLFFTHIFSFTSPYSQVFHLPYWDQYAVTTNLQSPLKDVTQSIASLQLVFISHHLHNLDSV